VSAAVGLAVGLGNYFVASVTTVALLLALVGLRRPRRWLLRRTMRHERVTVTLAPGAASEPVVAAIRDLRGAAVRSMVVHERAERGHLIDAELRCARGIVLDDLIVPIAERDDVAEVELL
jgi:uncharacterized membrane protein YhiD involved in acid resistance